MWNWKIILKRILGKAFEEEEEEEEEEEDDDDDEAEPFSWIFFISCCQNILLKRAIIISFKSLS